MPTLDEGEVVDNGNHGGSRATSMSQGAGRNSVDRQDRSRYRNESPDGDNSSRYSTSSRRSRSPRGYNRLIDDRDNYGRRNDRGYHRGNRGYGQRYDNRRNDGYSRSRVSYEDLDGHASRATYLDYDSSNRRDRHNDMNSNYNGRQRDRYHDKRQRQRSHSPRGRHHTDHGRHGNDQGHDSGRFDGNNGTRDGCPNDSRSPKYDAKSDKESSFQNEPAKDHQPPKEPSPEPDYEEPEPIDEDAEIERRRKRRQEIIDRANAAAPAPLLVQAVGAAAALKVQPESPVTTQPNSPRMDTDPPQTPRTPRSELASPQSTGSPMNLFDEKHLMNTHAAVKSGDDYDEPSAADYDPTADMKEDERRDELRHGQVVLHGEPHAVKRDENDAEVVPPVEVGQNDGGDNSDDDDFDMFADEFDEEKYTTKNKPAPYIPLDAIDMEQTKAKEGMLEGSDADGYYKARVGEILNGRYQVTATLGKGMFSNVVQALDVSSKKLVAIKLIRNNDALRKGGFTEIAILEKLNATDPDDKKHIIRFERHFDYRGHLCMTFESQHMNLREVLRKFGKDVGINLPATRIYAHQMFTALAHMRKCDIIHADLKPDNILLNEPRTMLKICDLGTAIDRADAATSQCNVTPYLVSRFYRAPEIILGINYDYAVDMWSIGCTLYELYTGKILFTGGTNNQMLKSIMEVRGKITPKLFKRGDLSHQHFDDMGQFISIERDKVLGKTNVRTLSMAKPTRDLRTRLTAVGMSDVQVRDLNHFIDLLDHCLTLNPDKRIKPADALRHPFFTARAGGNSRR